MKLLSILSFIAPIASAFTEDFQFRVPQRPNAAFVTDTARSRERLPPSTVTPVSAPLPQEDMSTKAAFEQRIQYSKASKTTGELKRPRRASPSSSLKRPKNVKTLSTVQEYLQILAESSKIVVVRFHAPFCKACKLTEPAYFGTAKKFPNVQFVDLSVNAKSMRTFREMGITTFPHGRIHHPTEGLVEELMLSRPNLSKFSEKLQSYYLAGGYNELQSSPAYPWSS